MSKIKKPCACAETYPQLQPGKLNHGPGCRLAPSPTLRAQVADVEPHLRTNEEKEELFPRLELLADSLCQTQAFIFHALKQAGLTVVPLDPSAREISPVNSAAGNVSLPSAKRKQRYVCDNEQCGLTKMSACGLAIHGTCTACGTGLLRRTPAPGAGEQEEGT